MKRNRKMIYWPITPGAEYEIAIPLNQPLTEAELQDGVLTIELRNNVGRWNLDGSGLDWDATPAWLKISQVNSDDLDSADWPPVGEYTYVARISVSSEDESGTDRILSVGLLQFGEYDHNPHQYQDNYVEYEQYN